MEKRTANPDDLLNLEWLSRFKEEIAAIEVNSEEAFKKLKDRENLISSLSKGIGSLPPEIRPYFGKLIHEIITIYKEKVNAYRKQKEKFQWEKYEIPDATLPSWHFPEGSLSPITIVIDRIVGILGELGYRIADGPELEDDWHNFTALNFPEDHPSRDMQDTLFIEDIPLLMRTHTSNVQIRAMEKTLPPFKIVCPGRVYRNERISARAHFQFHQVEGLYVDKNVSFANLKHDVSYLCKKFFGENVMINFRPSYFPFTEPSAEVDVSCLICNGSGCKLCKGSGWVEVMGCGVVHPHVLKNCGINPEEWSGFAFGLGVERFAMLLFHIPDIRYFTDGDIRFFSQFSIIL